VLTRPGTIVNALPPAPVAAGNVETSQRLVDVLFGALAQAAPDLIPAASCGSMNNVAIGAPDGSFTYYETIGGGMGARPDRDGLSGIHTHMTNTMNTPVEALEHAYPFQVVRYGLRENSGGKGRFRGGDGIIRAYRFLAPAHVSLLTERRRLPPYGLAGGDPGRPGANELVRGGRRKRLKGKVDFEVETGDVLVIRTPGGGGWGEPG
ncbi:MAG: hydantoinase B/oxoprolinase family protein, partial [Deltaproteobacteria bacterium]